MQGNSCGRRRARWIVPLGLTGCLACSDPSPDADVLAIYSGGEVLTSEVEEVILRRPASLRRPADGDFPRWYRDLVRDVAVRKILVEEAEGRALLEEPEAGERWHESRKQVVVGQFLTREVPREPATEEELRAYFEENRDAFRKPPRRQVYHLFLRPREGETRAALEARLGELRERSLAGEPFPLLAREHSESQLRHREGLLGWIQPGQLPPALDRLVFSLEEAVPSQVHMTDSGAHLFYAARVLEGLDQTFEEARSPVRRQVEQQKRSAAVAQYLESREHAEGSYLPAPEELGALLAGGDPLATVLRVGTWTLSSLDFVERLEKQPWWDGSPGREQAAYAFLRSIERSERAYREADRSGFLDQPAVVEAVEEARRNLLFEQATRRLLIERIEEEPGRLEAYHDANRKRFITPLRFRLRRLVVPLGPGAGRAMRRLEEARADLDSGATTLEALAEQLGGAVEDTLWQKSDELEQTDPEALRLLAGVGPGGHSVPLRTAEAIAMYEVLERVEPTEQPLDRVRDQVLESYLQEHGRELFTEFSDSLLQGHGLRLLDDRLERFAAAAVGAEPGPRPSPTTSAGEEEAG